MPDTSSTTTSSAATGAQLARPAQLVRPARPVPAAASGATATPVNITAKAEDLQNVYDQLKAFVLKTLTTVSKASEDFWNTTTPDNPLIGTLVLGKC